MNNNSKNLVRSALLLAIAIIIQSIGRNIPQISQLFVGSIVNTILIIAAFVCGTSLAICVGALTPLLAWLIGQLPAPMGPFVPFIMIGNALLILVFGIIKNDSTIRQIIGIILGSLCKFLFLYLSASKLINLLNINLPSKIAKKLIIMMGLPQLITALIGGFIALILVNIMKKRKAL
ncbi:ECF transporter S component [Haloimpatiens sp. FM7330]|uniref:ECF transporter S component n=1 Tax=Haloimpatiens sp. FM7330 TaxID=3298610 RepID=UPI00363CCFDF